MIPGYETVEMLHRGQAVEVYRARRKSDKTTVILKTLRSDVAAGEHAARLRYEHRVLLELKQQGSANVPAVYELCDKQGHIAIVMEDINGVSLASLKSKLSLKDILHIGSEVCAALTAVHRVGIIHKDVNPNNIIFDPGSMRVQLIDFNLATRISREQQNVENLRLLEGTLNYLSPEQTGRMNRVLDSRSDLYSLGATLYELVSGQPPFQEAEVHRLVHQILTRIPKRLDEAQADVPGIVASIVAALMAKDPDQRYQSAQGLLADLSTCLRQWPLAGRIENFELMREDRSERFSLPEKLYGREGAVANVLAAYRHVSSGQRQVLWVLGASGIGKSAVVNELQGAMVERDEILARGKCDQLRRHIPFDAVVQVIDTLMRRILMESEESVEHWRRRIGEQLHRSAQALIDLVPSLGVLLGPQKPLPPLGPQETENRLLSLLRRFMRVLSREKTLVLFFDDLQWADSGTLKFLRGLFAEEYNGAGLLVIGAYRDSEVNADHPLQLTMAELTKVGARTSSVLIEPLSHQDVFAFLSDATHARPSRVEELAAVVLEKTFGNPYFIREFAKYIHAKGLLTYDGTAHCWNWELDAIREAPIGDDLVQFMKLKLRDLSEDERACLSVAASMGGTFKLHELVVASGLKRDLVLRDLWASVQAGFVIPLTRAARFADDSDKDIVYKFSHDKLQQAAYEMLSKEEAIELHYRIGTRMAAQFAQMGDEAWGFDCVNHLNRGIALIQDPEEKLRVAKLNLRAGQEALRSAAYGIALSYLSAGLNLLPADAWDSHYALARAVNLGLSQAEFLAGSSEQAESRLVTILHHAKTQQERSEVQIGYVRVLGAVGKHARALQVAVDALRETGLKLSHNPTGREVIWTFFKINLATRGRRVDQLAEMPMVTDPLILTQAQLLVASLTSAFIANSNLYSVLVMTLVLLTLAHGNTPMSASAFGAIAIVWVQMNNYRNAVAWAKASRDCLQRLPHSVSASSAHMLIAGWGYAETAPEDICANCVDGYQRALQEGEPAFQSLNLFFHLLTVSGVSLARASEIANNRDAVDGQQLEQLLAARQMIRCLQGATQSPSTWNDETYDEAAAKERCVKLGGIAAPTFYSVRTISHCVMGEYELACATAREAFKWNAFKKHVDLLSVSMAFFACLAEMQQAASHGRSRVADPKIFAKCLGKLRGLAAAGPAIYGGLPKLLEAEMAGLRGQHAVAIKLYEEANEALSTCGYRIFSAAGLESAARFHLRIGSRTAAKGFMRQALDTYEAWGATAKVTALRASCGALLTELEAEAAPRSSTGRTTTVRQVEVGKVIDLPALMEAAQAFARETRLETLLVRVMETLLASSGATRSVLLLRDAGVLSVGADSAAPMAGKQVEASVALSVVNFVMRISESMLVDAPFEQFMDDPYLQGSDAKSVLCIPLLYLGQSIGAVYLENSMVSGAFTPKHATVSQVIASQAAIAMANLRLHTDLERTIAERTSQLRDAHQKLVVLERQTTEVQMAGGFAHEMRNALAGAAYMLNSGFGEAFAASLAALRAQVSPKDESAVAAVQDAAAGLRDSLEVIGEGVARAARITSNILEYAQVGHVRKGVDSIQVRGVVERIVESISSDLRTCQIGLNIDVAADICLVMEESHAHTILSNLINNARDALQESAEGQERRLTVSSQIYSGNVCIAVHNTGNGIGDEVKSRIFEPFFTTKGSKGTGLGLGLSKKLAEVYGGSLDFTSEERSGTTFRLVVPADLVADPGAKSPRSQKA